MVLELFGPEFKDKLFEELVQLNIKALDEAKKRTSRQTTWVSIKELQSSTGWGSTKLKENFSSSNLEKVGNTFTIWKMFSGFVGQCKNKSTRRNQALNKITKTIITQGGRTWQYLEI